MVSRAPAVWIAALGLLAAACGSSGDGARATTSGATRSSVPAISPSTAVTSTQPTVAPVSTIGRLPNELAGTFAVVLAVADVPAADEAGFWYLTLSSSTGYAFGRVPGSPQNTGVLTVSGPTVTFSGERGEGACGGKGTYRWRVSGTTLTFVLVNDTCNVRVKQSTAKTYQRCPRGPDTCVEPPS